MNLVKTLAQFCIPYITITGLKAGCYYTYHARYGECLLPVVDIEMHQPKIVGEAVMYICVKSNADLNELSFNDRLYIGAQSGPDRMFRGDGLKGNNFHHQQMRKGKGTDNLETFLANGDKVTIYVIRATTLTRIIGDLPNFACLERLLTFGGKFHLGYCFEQLILHHEHRNWRWNTNGADAKFLNALRDER